MLVECVVLVWWRIFTAVDPLLTDSTTNTHSLNGLTENSGRENDGPSKLQGMKLQDMKLQDMKLQDMKMQDMKMTDMKMQDMKMTDEKWRQGQGVKWNAKSILSLFCLKRSPLVCSFVSCYFIPAFSCPAISCPAISCPANWSINFTSVIFTSSIFSAPHWMRSMNQCMNQSINEYEFDKRSARSPLFIHSFIPRHQCWLTDREKYLFGSINPSRSLLVAYK